MNRPLIVMRNVHVVINCLRQFDRVRNAIIPLAWVEEVSNY